MAQLVEWLLLTAEVHGSNLINYAENEHVSAARNIEKTEINEKEAEIVPS